MSPVSDPTHAVTDSAPATRRGTLGKRLLLMVVVFVLAAKPADLLLGYLAGTHRRHLLRLDPNAAVRHRSAEFDYVFHTNRYGFRGPVVAEAKPVGRQRLVVLGDSFVAGVAVADEDVFTAVLSEKLSAGGIEVVNVGRAGTSTIREVTLYEQIGRRFAPDAVILVYFLGNDLAEVVEEETDEELADWKPSGILRRAAFAWCSNAYLELAMQKRVARNLASIGPRTTAQVLARVRDEATRSGVDPDLAAGRYGRLPESVRDLAEAGELPEYRFLQACLAPARFRHSIDPDDEFFQRAWPRTRRHLDRLKRSVESDGATLLLVVIPESMQVSEAALEFNRRLGFELDDEWNRASPGRTAEALARWARESGVPVLDVKPALKDHPGPTFFAQDGHWTAVGHRVIARSLAAWPALRTALRFPLENGER